jgi:hypothetical protein
VSANENSTERQIGRSRHVACFALAMRTASASATLLFVAACTSAVAPETSDRAAECSAAWCADALSEFPEELVFGPHTMGPAEESEDLCVSWTVDTAGPTFLNTITSDNGPGIHHSNWYWVPPNLYTGGDGVWSCRERGFDNLAAALAGGIIFGTSTQAPTDEQRLAPGVAVRIPARARIVGNIHVLNASASAIDSHVRLRVSPIPADEVTDEVQPLGFVYEDLALDPRARSRFVADCDVSSLSAGADDARPVQIYTGGAHYHALGTGARAEVVGGPRDGEILFETTSPIGHPLTRTYETPLDLMGVDTIRFSCDFDNPRDEAVEWGIGDQEMCAIGFSTNSVSALGAAVIETVETREVDGVLVHTGECIPIAVR